MLEARLSDNQPGTFKCKVPNYLPINASKTQAMIVGPVPYRYKFTVDNDEVDANDTLKYLYNLYNAYILAHLEYWCPLLLGVGRGQDQKLEDTNNCILRSILRYGKHTPYNHLLNVAGIRTLEGRRKFQSLD